MNSALVLQDGTVFEGTGFGAPGPTVDQLESSLEKGAGEVVFNTAMSGYVEVLTDPSYTGQLVTMTYPHVGNYGVELEWSEVGPEPSRPVVKVAGFVLRSLYTGPVPDGRTTLDAFLLEYGTPGITGIDTRRLTLKTRDEGAQNGIILRGRSGAPTSSEVSAAVAYLAGFPSMVGRNLVPGVGTREQVIINESGSPTIALFDCGIKANIIRRLVAANARLVVLPSDASLEELRASGADALFVSNGPGDPAVLESQIDLIRESLGSVPVLGICLGHQLIAEAMGAKTYKMKFGHHGVNHPVRDELSKRVFVTSQNHGFAVDEETLPKGTIVWFRNANDASIEGLINEGLQVRTTQFHPESAPGPHDSYWIFDEFLKVVS
jgi:carbamoyl-phosphate synthase small subunit